MSGIYESPATTIMVGYLMGIAKQLDAKGVHAPTILKSAGVSNPLSNDPLNRFSSALLSDVLKLSAQATGDKFFALNAARTVKATYFHVVGLGLLSSGTLLTFCERLMKFMPLIGGSGSMFLERSASSYRLVTRVRGPMCLDAQDSWLAHIYDLMCEVSARRVPLLSVQMMHSKPLGSDSVYSEAFQAPVQFGNDALAIELSSEVMSEPLVSGCEKLASIQDTSAMEYLVRLNGSDIICRLQLAIMSCLQEDQSVSMEHVAARVRLSPRQIGQQLAENNTSYQTVLDQTRFYLAKVKLRDPQLPISEVAYALGFTDSANFSRAFRRWAKTSPLCYRNQMQERRRRTGEGLAA